MVLSVWAVGLLGVTAGCGPRAAIEFTAADESSIRQASEGAATALNAKDFTAWPAVYADDAVVFLPTGSTIAGRAAIAAWGSTGGGPLAYQAQPTEIDGRGDIAYARGSFLMKLTLKGASAPVEERGEYIQIWRKQADGSWKVSREMFSSDLLKWP